MLTRSPTLLPGTGILLHCHKHIALLLLIHDEHPLFVLQQRVNRPRRRARSSSLVVAAGPPDDFIDTTAVEEEGSSYVGVDFEQQELRVIFEAMDKNNIFFKMLAEEQIVSLVDVN